jgi:peptidoglycan hydrolase-like protein with peptidoglycan-binding domain
MLRFAALAVLLAGTTVAAAAATAQESSLLFVQPLNVEAVRQIQGKLAAMGVYSGPVDGTWGPASAAALRSYQQSQRLQVTGEMNPATAAIMGFDPATLLASAPPPPPQPAPVYALSADSTRIIQARLHQLGFYSGAVDAAWGPGSQTALQNFQSANGLPADGRLTKATVLALGIDPSTMQAAQ